MEKLTVRQVEYLIFFALRNGTDHGITEAAEVFKVSKPTVFNVTESLVELGMIEKKKQGEITLTEKGKEYAKDDTARAIKLSKWLASSVGVTPYVSEVEAIYMVASLRSDTIDAILVHAGCNDSVYEESSNNVFSDVENGNYYVDFSVYREDGQTKSMGDKGFEKPCLAVKSDGGTEFHLKPKKIKYRRSGHRTITGVLERIWIRKNGAWEELEEMDGSFVLKDDALAVWKDDFGTYGSVQIRARASVGMISMPESEAEMRFSLGRIKIIDK